MAVKYASPRRQSVFPLPLKSRGSILMVVLWSLCLLAAFAVILGYEVRQKASLVKRLDERDRLRFISEAGARKVISELKKEQPKSYDALNDKWSSNPAAFKDIVIGGGTADVYYNYIDELSGAPELRYGLMDEEAKVNLNAINEENKAEMLVVLQRLFISVLNYNEVQAQELAACIIDWRDADSNESISFGSAEDSYYIGLPYPYKAKNAAFETLEELLLVRGIDENVFRKIRNYVTIYGGGRININTASKAVLLALGLNEDTVSKIMGFRAGEDGITATADDNIFDLSSTIVLKLSQFADLSAAEVAQLNTVAGKYLSTKSGNFSAKCSVKLNNSRYANEIYYTLSRNGKILYWQEP